jgi:hypothetical protein
VRLARQVINLIRQFVRRRNQIQHPRGQASQPALRLKASSRPPSVNSVSSASSGLTFGNNPPKSVHGEPAVRTSPSPRTPSLSTFPPPVRPASPTLDHVPPFAPVTREVCHMSVAVHRHPVGPACSVVAGLSPRGRQDNNDVSHANPPPPDSPRSWLRRGKKASRQCATVARVDPDPPPQDGKRLRDAMGIVKRSASVDVVGCLSEACQVRLGRLSDEALAV